jgi:hypothetical protein
MRLWQWWAVGYATPFSIKGQARNKCAATSADDSRRPRRGPHRYHGRCRESSKPNLHERSVQKGRGEICGPFVFCVLGRVFAPLFPTDGAQLCLAFMTAPRGKERVASEALADKRARQGDPPRPSQYACHALRSIFEPLSVHEAQQLYTVGVIVMATHSQSLSHGKQARSPSHADSCLALACWACFTRWFNATTPCCSSALPTARRRKPRTTAPGCKRALITAHRISSFLKVYELLWCLLFVVFVVVAGVVVVGVVVGVVVLFCFESPLLNTHFASAR